MAAADSSGAALGGGGGDVIDIPPEVLRDTMTSVVSAIVQSGHLSKSCNDLIEELVGSGAFKGPAAAMAIQTMTEINGDMQKILTHGTALAEHLGTTADVMDDNDQNSISQFSAVLGNLGLGR